MLYLVQNDAGTQLRVVLTREDDGAAVDLTDATVRLKFRKKGTTTLSSTLTSIATSNEDKSAGVALFEFSASNLDIDEGKYEGEIEATFGNGSTESVFEVLDFYIREDF